MKLEESGPQGISAGDSIGYHPKGNEDLRALGYVQGWDGVHFGVQAPDDPGIEEKVRPEWIEAHTSEDDAE